MAQSIETALAETDPRRRDSILRVTAALDAHATKHGTRFNVCRPSIRQLCTDTGLSRRTVYRCLADLREHGLIDRRIRGRVVRHRTGLCELKPGGHPRGWQGPSLTTLHWTSDTPSRTTRHRRNNDRGNHKRYEGNGDEQTQNLGAASARCGADDHPARVDPGVFCRLVSSRGGSTPNLDKPMICRGKYGDRTFRGDRVATGSTTACRTLCAVNALVAAMGKVVPVKEPFPRITVGPGLMNPEGLAAIMLALNGQSILGREHRNPMGRRGYALAGGLYPSGSTFPGSGTVPSAG